MEEIRRKVAIEHKFRLKMLELGSKFEGFFVENDEIKFEKVKNGVESVLNEFRMLKSLKIDNFELMDELNQCVESARVKFEFLEMFGVVRKYRSYSRE